MCVSNVYCVCVCASSPFRGLVSNVYCVYASGPRWGGTCPMCIVCMYAARLGEGVSSVYCVYVCCELGREGMSNVYPVCVLPGWEGGRVQRVLCVCALLRRGGSNMFYVYVHSGGSRGVRPVNGNLATK